MVMAIINGAVACVLLMLGYYVGKSKGVVDGCEEVIRLIKEMSESADGIRRGLENGLDGDTEN